MTRRVPVVVVAGFLGAGKTTLVNRLLRSGARIGVVVNDFGDVSIDALLVAGSVDGSVGWGSGCICCTADSESLTDVLATLARPSARLDAVVIETSGIAEPASVIRMILASTDRNVVYGGMVYVVDGARIDAARSRHPQIDRHIAIADLVVVNKTDLLSSEREADVLAQMRRGNATAAVVPTSDAVLDPTMILDMAPSPDAAPRQLDFGDLLADTDCDTHLHALYESVVLDTDRPIHPRRFAAFLERPPTGVYRIKGVVRFDVHRNRRGDRDRYVVHAVGGHVTAERVGRSRDRTSSESAPTRNDVVVIGMGMDVDAVYTALVTTTARPDEPPDPHAMLSITRYDRART